MLAIRLRVRPWSARCSPRSVGRVTRISPSSCLTSIARALASESSPLGPFTLTCSAWMLTSTPSGTAMGCFPMRDIGLPDPRHELAAHAGAAGVMAAHYAAGGGDDRGAHATKHLGDVAGADVAPVARPRQAVDAGDDRAAVLGVLEAHTERLAHAGRRYLVGLDVPLLLQNSGDLGLEARGGHLNDVVLRGDAIADARQQVSDRIGHRHPVTSSTWSGRGRSPRARPRAGRFGTGRTCAGRRASARSGGSGCTHGWRTWLYAGTSPPVTSLPLLGLLFLGFAFGFGRLGPLVGLGVLLLERLEGGLLGLGPLAGLLLAPLLIGLVGLLAGRGAARSALRREGHAQLAEEHVGLLVGGGRRGDGHVQPAHLVDRVVVDLGEDDLLADAQGVVAAAIEGARVEPAEVADARDGDRDEAVEELVHARAAKRDADPHRHALAQLEGGDRLPRAAHAGLLAGDGGQLLGGGLEHLRVLLGLADAHVEGDLGQPRHLHRARVAEALLETPVDLGLVALLEAGGHVGLGGGLHQSMSLPLRLATRTRRPPSSRRTPTRLGWPSGSSSCTLETWIGPGASMMPPCSCMVRGRWWRLMMFRPST